MEIKPNPFVEKNNNQIRIEQIDFLKKLRKGWGINPKTKIKPNKKKKQKKLNLNQVRKLIQGEDE